MVNKKFIIGWVVVFIVSMVGDFLIHGLLLMNDYSQLPNLMRSEADSQKYLPLLILAHVSLSGAFVWIYMQGVVAKPWLHQGLRFGVAVGFLTAVPTYLIYYVVQPISGMLAVKQIVLGSILIVLLGVLAAFIYRQPVPAPTGYQAIT